MRRVKLGMPLGLLVVLAACASTASPTSNPGSDTDSASATAGQGGADSGIGECDLWTLDEVNTATGVEVTQTIGSDMQGQFSCLYSDADGAPAATYVVTTSEAGIAPQAGYDAITEGTEPVSGIGEQAKWHEAGSLYVMSGANLYIVTVLAADLDDQQRREVASELAQVAIDRFQ